jgi:hypothetical protein
MKSHDELCAEIGGYFLERGCTVNYEVPREIPQSRSGRYVTYRTGWIDVLVTSPGLEGAHNGCRTCLIIEVKTHFETWQAGDVCRQLKGYQASLTMYDPGLCCASFDFRDRAPGEDLAPFRQASDEAAKVWRDVCRQCPAERRICFYSDADLKPFQSKIFESEKIDVLSGLVK